MKNLLSVLIVSLCFLSCSNDNDCSGNRAEINQYFDQQIQYVENNPSNYGIDYSQISLLNQERNKKLENACN